MNEKKICLSDIRDKHLDDVCDLANCIEKLCKGKDYGIAISAIGSAYENLVEEAMKFSENYLPKHVKEFILTDALSLILEDFRSIAKRNSIDLTFNKENGKEHQ